MTSFWNLSKNFFGVSSRFSFWYLFLDFSRNSFQESSRIFIQRLWRSFLLGFFFYDSSRKTFEGSYTSFFRDSSRSYVLDWFLSGNASLEAPPGVSIDSFRIPLEVYFGISEYAQMFLMMFITNFFQLFMEFLVEFSHTFRLEFFCELFFSFWENTFWTCLKNSSKYFSRNVKRVLSGFSTIVVTIVLLVIFF